MDTSKVPASEALVCLLCFGGSLIGKWRWSASLFAFTMGCHFEISFLVSSYAACRSNLSLIGFAKGTSSFWAADFLFFC